MHPIKEPLFLPCTLTTKPNFKPKNDHGGGWKGNQMDNIGVTDGADTKIYYMKWGSTRNIQNLEEQVKMRRDVPV